MKNIDGSQWLHNPELEVVETKKGQATGASFTLYADQATSGGGEEDAAQDPARCGPQGGIAMNLIEEVRSLDPRDPGPLAVCDSGRCGGHLVRRTGGGIDLFFRVDQPTARARPPPGGRARAAPAVPHQTREGKPISSSTSNSLRISNAPSELCYASFQVRPRFRTSWSTSRRPALGAGLEEKLFQPAPEEKRDFYAELPIKIRLTGSYHQFGEFVSGIAALPRIVTLHNIEIKPESKDSYDQLTLDVTARTYRYLDEDEIAAAEASKRKAAKTRAAGQWPAMNRPINSVSASVVALVCASVLLGACSSRDDDLTHFIENDQERARRPGRAAARGQALRELRVRIEHLAFAVSAGRLRIWGGLGRAPGTPSAIASSSNSIRSTP